MLRTPGLADIGERGMEFLVRSETADQAVDE